MELNYASCPFCLKIKPQIICQIYVCLVSQLLLTTSSPLPPAAVRGWGLSLGDRSSVGEHYKMHSLKTYLQNKF